MTAIHNASSAAMAADDDQFIEELRRRSVPRPWLGRCYLAVAVIHVIFLGALVWFWTPILAETLHWSQNPHATLQGAQIRLFINMTLYGVFVALLGSCIHITRSCVRLFNGEHDRAGDLAIRYHDELQRLTRCTDDEESHDD